MSRFYQEKQRREAQRQDFARDATMRRLHEDAVLLANEGSNDRVDAKRRLRILTEQQKEIDFINATEAKQYADASRKAQEEQEAMLAQELERMKHDQVVTEKRRQQLRDSNVELRELEFKLKAAYQNKEIQAQRMEREVATRTERETDRVVDRELNALREKEEELERAKEQQIAEAKRQHKQELLEQLSSQQQQQKLAYEEFLKEKLMIDDIVRKIHGEDQKAREHDLARRAQTRKEMEEFKAQQDQWRQIEAQHMAQENESIMRHAQEQSLREDERKAAQKQRAQDRAQLVGRIAQQVESDRAAREELDRLRQELYEQEMLERDRQLEVEAIEGKLRQRLALRREQELDIEERQRMREKERQDEEEFRKALMEKFAVEDKLEQMNAQKRRIKQQEHKRAVEALMEERRQRFLFEKEQQMREAEAAREEEASRRELIEQERQRLLREHAHRLLGFLPKGVIRDERDLDLLGDNFRAVYAPPRPVLDDD